MKVCGPAKGAYAPAQSYLYSQKEASGQFEGLAGRGVRLHERSRFMRDDGRWYYVDGDILNP